jgi:hypothetical protein
MKYLYRFAIPIAIAIAVQSSALADKFDACPDAEAARQFVKSCMLENPYNTRETCEARALEKLCTGK